MEILKNRIIIVDSASKSFSLCGARIGFAIAKPEVIEKIGLVNAHTVASVSDILQYGVAVAYGHVMSNPSYFVELRKTYRDRLEVSIDAIREFLPNVVAPRPTGAFYLMLQFPELEDISDFAIYLLEKFNLGNETVAVSPAASFYLTPDRGKNEVRLAMVVPPEKMRRSIFIIAEALKAFNAFRGLKKKPSLSTGSHKIPANASHFRTIA